MWQARVYRGGRLTERSSGPGRLPVGPEDPHAVVWVTCDGDRARSLSLLRDDLGLPPAAAEDALRPGQRTRIDRRDGYLRATVHLTRIDPGTVALTTSELGIVVIGRCVVTIARTTSTATPEPFPAAPLETDGPIRDVGSVLHHVLDAAVESHFAAVEGLEDAIDAIEASLFTGRPSDSEAHLELYAIRKALVGVRRVALPMREVVLGLTRHGEADVGDTTDLLDLYDDVLRVAEWTEALRDLVTTLQDATLQLQSNRINVVMRRLSAWAAVFAASTAITGFYGMNVLVPQYGTGAGALTASALLVVAVVALVLLFRHHRWL